MTLSLNRRTLSPLHCASSDSTRFNINSLRVEADGTTIATNGHLMAVVTPGKPLEGSEQLEPFTLEADHLKNLNKDQRKKNAPDNWIDTQATNANGHCRLETISGAGAVEIPKLQCEYPNWKQIQPTGEPHYSVRISLHVLEQMIATARQFTDTKKGQGGTFGTEASKSIMQFDFRSDGLGGATHMHPIVVTTEDKVSGDSLYVAMMPCRK